MGAAQSSGHCLAGKRTKYFAIIYTSVLCKNMFRPVGKAELALMAHSESNVSSMINELADLET